MTTLDEDERQRREWSLAGVPLLAAMAQDIDSTLAGSPWTKLVAKFHPVHIEAGRYLFREGDPADDLYVIVSGRLEVLVEDPEPLLIRTLGAGAAVGELAILAESTRSASVRARRDSELLRVSRDEFTEILNTDPQLAIPLARQLSRQLQLSRSRFSDADTLPQTVAVIPAQVGEAAAAFGAELAEALRPLGGTDVLRDAVEPGESEETAIARFGFLVNRTERAGRRVLLIGGELAAQSPWTRFCLHTGDRTLLLSDVRANPARLAGLGVEPGADLVLVGTAPSGGTIGDWRERFQPRAIHLVPDGAGRRPAIDRLARRLAGRALGIVFSGGGARGFAHLGVLDELAAAGITIDRMAGCSMGSYVAAQAAVGATPEEIYERCHAEFVKRNVLRPYTVPYASVLHGGNALGMLRRTFGTVAIEELPREFYAVSCDLVSAQLVVHRSGPLWLAVGASMALPAIYPPMPYAGGLQVDGGVLNNLPVEQMAMTGEGPVIAVDVSGIYEPSIHRSRLLRRRRAAWLSRAGFKVMTGWPTPLPSIVEVVARTVVLGSVDTRAAAEKHADLVITPVTPNVGMTDWSRIDEMREAGRRATAEVIGRAVELAG